MHAKDIVDGLMAQQRFPKIKSSQQTEESQKNLDALGIPKDSEFYAFYSHYFVFALDGNSNTYELAECCKSVNNLPLYIKFGHEAWELPHNYLLFSTGSSESGYLYNKEDGTVWDFELGDQAYLGTNQVRHWNSFYAFMIWYLTPDVEE